MRRIAILLKISRTTVERKIRFLAKISHLENEKDLDAHPLVSEMQFDDLETFEHTKLKPLSVTVAVEKKTRFVLGAVVSRMPAKGLLVYRALKKYGPRADERFCAREALFERLKPLVSEKACIESDSNPHYTPSVEKWFPCAQHLTYLSRKACVVGQGELKQGEFDPLFSLNHTLAMFRANINRLARKTWCTTKLLERLQDHIAIYINYHNRYLIHNPTKAKRIPSV